MEFYLIRHTRVKVPEGTCYGQTDVAPADTFPWEVSQVLQKLKEAGPLRFFSSPLKRCLLLARALSPSPVETDERLMEMDFGAFEMQAWDALDAAHLQGWMEDYVNRRCPGGESYQDLQQRSVASFRDISARGHPGVALVVHGGVIRAILSHVLPLPLNRSFRLQIDPGGVTRITEKKGLYVVRYVNR